MTHDDDIPELIGRLEPSLSVPDPQAIHTGLSRRKTARKRMAGAAGTFVAALAITGGALALTGDDTTTTATASDAAELQAQSDDASRAVADDSAPFKEVAGVSIPRMKWFAMHSMSGEVPADLRFESDTQFSRSSLTRGTSQFLWFGAADGQDDEVAFSTGCAASSYKVDWNEKGFVVTERLGQANWFPSTPFGNRVLCSALAEPLDLFEIGDIVTVGQRAATADPDFTRFSVTTSDTRFGFDLGFSATATDANIIVPSLEGLDFLDALDIVFELGLRVTQIEEATSEVEQDVVIRTDPPAGTSVDERSIVTIFTSAGASRPLDEPEEPPVTVAVAPPAFSASADAQLWGQWTVVELWSDGARIDVGSFPGPIPSMTLDGKTFGGHDGCNNHGNGLFLPSADGSIQIETGRTTLMGCPGNPALTAFAQGALNATQWGLSPSGNLVLANGPVVVVFEQTGPLPQ